MAPISHLNSKIYSSSLPSRWNIIHNAPPPPHMLRSSSLKYLPNRFFFLRTMSSQAQFTKNLPSRTPSSEESKIIQDILAVSPPSPFLSVDKVDVRGA